MRVLAQRLSHSICRFNQAIGHCLAWLVGLMAITVCVIVIARTFFSVGSIALQESVTYMHAFLFMLCLAYTAHAQGHVRVDIFYRRLSPVNRSWVDAIGAVLFLLPFSMFLLVISWQFALESWAIYEGSINPGGIPAVFLLKTLIPLAGFLLVLRALSEVVDNVINITYVDDTEQEETHSLAKEGGKP